MLYTAKSEPENSEEFLLNGEFLHLKKFEKKFQQHILLCITNF